MGWYALYCRSGQEDTIISSCKQNLSRQALTDAFQFSYERMKKYLGEWHVDTLAMFPNYVFLQSDHPEALSEELEQYRKIVNVLENDRLLLEVCPEEEDAIKKLCGETHHMGMSRGIIADGKLNVLEGPLRGRESIIRKVDRHKRIAKLDLHVTREIPDIWAGLEITARS